MKSGRSSGTPSFSRALLPSQPSGHSPLSSAFITPLHLTQRVRKVEGWTGTRNFLTSAAKLSRAFRLSTKTAGGHSDLCSTLRDDVRSKRFSETHRAKSCEQSFCVLVRFASSAAVSSSVSMPSNRSQRVNRFNDESQRKRSCVRSEGRAVPAGEVKKATTALLGIELRSPHTITPTALQQLCAFWGLDSNTVNRFVRVSSKRQGAAALFVPVVKFFLSSAKVPSILRVRYTA